MRILDLKEGEKYTFISPKGFSQEVVCVKIKKYEAYFYYPEIDAFGSDDYIWLNDIEIERYIY